MKLSTVALLGLGAALIVVGWHDTFGDGQGTFAPWLPVSSAAVPVGLAMSGAALVTFAAMR